MCLCGTFNLLQEHFHQIRAFLHTVETLQVNVLLKMSLNVKKFTFLSLSLTLSQCMHTMDLG